MRFNSQCLTLFCLLTITSSFPFFPLAALYWECDPGVQKRKVLVLLLTRLYQLFHWHDNYDFYNYGYIIIWFYNSCKLIGQNCTNRENSEYINIYIRGTTLYICKHCSFKNMSALSPEGRFLQSGAFNSGFNRTARKTSFQVINREEGVIKVQCGNLIWHFRIMSTSWISITKDNIMKPVRNDTLRVH